MKVPAASPVTLLVTVNVAGVVPVAGETVSQERLPALAVNVVLGLALTEIVCDAGDAPPAMAANDSDAGLTVSVGDAAPTVNETGILSVSPFPVTVTVPE